MISIENEERPWGRFFVLHDEPNYKIKRIEVNPEADYPISTIKDLKLDIIKGKGTITLEGETNEFSEGDTI